MAPCGRNEAEGFNGIGVLCNVDGGGDDLDHFGQNHLCEWYIEEV